MPTAALGVDQFGNQLAMIPPCAAIISALFGGAIVRRRFDMQTAVCSLPLLTISGYNFALCVLLALGLIR